MMPMLRVAWCSLILSMPMLMTGCAAQQCDPNRADLFSGIGCAAGGGYANRTRDLQGQYQAASSNAQSQSLAAIAAQQEVGDAQAQLAQRERELAELDQSSAELRRRLDAAKHQHGVSQDRVKAAEAELARLRQERSRTGASSSQAQIDALKQRQQKVADIMARM